jgi:branched-chain amino acid transport system substrate-binding protein
MKRLNFFPLALLASVLIFAGTATAADGTITVGFNIAQEGMFALVGSHSINAGELIRKEVEAQGGLKIGDKTYELKFIYGDNKSNATDAANQAIQFVTKDKVIGVIAPNFSALAIPAGQMANSFSTPMISPWSTSPITTKDRPFVFRSCFVFTIQGPVLTKFVAKEFNATKAAVLYDIISAYPRGMAKSFRDAFEDANGKGSVVAFEEFRTGATDFSKQLKKIKESGAQVLFTPQHYDEIPLIVRQAKQMGLTIPIIGSNSWAGGDLTGTCGEDCNGLFFTGNYAPGEAKGINKKYVESYQKAYNELPDEPSALTWDSVRVLLKALENTGGLTGNLLKDRIAVKDEIVKIRNMEGATGMLNFNASGNPEKCAIVVKIVDGVFTFHDSVCP